MTDPIRAEIARRGVSDATLEKTDGRWVLTMSRDLRHPVERVWPMLTEPERLAQWSPVVPDRPFTTVGPATAQEQPAAPRVDAEVLVCEPPRELVHRWGDQLLRWTLEPTPEGSRLTLAHTFDERDGGAVFAAGWHICLATLAARLDGHDVTRVVGEDATAYGWDDLRGRYDAAL
jgi:uncharacterized protein YndB with AHSA1/START domain